MNESSISELTALIAVIGTVAVAYGKALGATQMQLVQWVIDALRIERRYRGLLNLAIGFLLAMALSAIAAWIISDLRFLAVGLLAGLIASVEAAKAHDDGAVRSEK